MKGRSKLLLGLSILGLFGLLVSFFSRQRPRVCPTCKRELERHWKFCPYDGTAIK